jgi:DNA/RNA-binding domain of Phe-tRNA-synthetase-like protein
MAAFQYHPDILARYPQVVGGVIIASGLHSGENAAKLRDLYMMEQQAIRERTPDSALSEIPSLAAWRGAFRKFGVEPTKYRSAAEALLRRLTKKGDIPSINMLVDIGNLVSIRYALPVAVIDRRAVQGAITVQFATGNEESSRLGKDDADKPEAGEVIFSDEAGHVIARRWCWRQSMESAATPDTTDVIITVEAHHGRADVEKAVNDLAALLGEYAGGSSQRGILDVDNPSI